MQKLLHQAIYDRTYGIKATVPVSDRSRQEMIQCVKILQGLGAEAVLSLSRFVTGVTIPVDGGTLAAGGWYKLAGRARWTNRPRQP